MRLVLSTSRRFALAAVFFLAAAFAFPHAALAHAVLQKSTPVANTTVHAGANGDFPVVLTFNSRIDAVHSTLSLLSGTTQKGMPLKVDIKAAPNMLQSTVPAAKPGHYTLQWQVVASDGHISRGVVPFDVR